MTGNRWWYVLFAATMVVLAVIAATGGATHGRVIGAWATLGVLTACYAAFGWRAINDRRLTWPFVAVLVLGSGIAVAFIPDMAIIQSIAFPLIWTTVANTRAAIVANIALAAAVALGFIADLGARPEVFVQAFTIEGISLAGSVALGLWITRIAALSHERKQLLEQLTATQEQLAWAHRESGVTSERERLAREIHDTIAQSLTGVVMLSQRAQRELAGGSLSLLAEQLAVLEESARDALVETRSLVAASSPVELGAGIGPALERLAARFGRETGIVVTVTADVAADLDRDTEVVLLRSAQEALANVRKHSGATTAALELQATDARATLTAIDDGAGFDTSVPASGFGLPGMRERLALVGGELEIVSAPGAGTRLVVSLPTRVTA